MRFMSLYFAGIFEVSAGLGFTRPEVLRAAVNDAVSVCALVLGPFDGINTTLFQGGDGSGDGMVGWAA